MFTFNCRGRYRHGLVFLQGGKDYHVANLVALTAHDYNFVSNVRLMDVARHEVSVVTRQQVWDAERRRATVAIIALRRFSRSDVPSEDVSW